MDAPEFSVRDTQDLLRKRLAERFPNLSAVFSASSRQGDFDWQVTLLEHVPPKTIANLIENATLAFAEQLGKMCDVELPAIQLGFFTAFSKASRWISDFSHDSHAIASDIHLDVNIPGTPVDRVWQLARPYLSLSRERRISRLEITCKANAFVRIAKALRLVSPHLRSSRQNYNSTACFPLQFRRLCINDQSAAVLELYLTTPVGETPIPVSLAHRMTDQMVAFYQSQDLRHHVVEKTDLFLILRDEIEYDPGQHALVVTKCNCPPWDWFHPPTEAEKARHALEKTTIALPSTEHRKEWVEPPFLDINFGSDDENESESEGWNGSFSISGSEGENTSDEEFASDDAEE